MKKSHLLFTAVVHLTLLGFVSATSCFISSDSSGANPQTKMYESADYKIRIEYPNTWWADEDLPKEDFLHIA